MGREFGLASRFTLSYDFTFLALMDMSLNGKRLTADKQRCIAHPLKKEYAPYAVPVLNILRMQR